MSNTNNSNNIENNHVEKKNFTEILSDKAEKAGEAAADAVNHFTEMLTSKDKSEVENVSNESDSKTSIEETGKVSNSESHTCKLKSIVAEDSSDKKTINPTCKFKMYFINSMLVIYDLFAVSLSYFLALWFRFDGEFSQIPRNYLKPYLEFIPFYAIGCIIIFAIFKLYKSIWKYASVIEAFRVVMATMITGICHIIFITLCIHRMPLSYYFFGPVFQFFLILGIRYAYRVYLILRRRYTRDISSLKRVMIIGAGEAGRNIIREIQRCEEMHEVPVCVIDGDQTKWHKQIEGVPVLGGRESILLCVEKYNIDKIYFAIPSASKKDQRDILTICSETKCELKTLPGIYQLANGEVDIKTIRDVNIEDLLGREQINVDMDEIYNQLSGQVVLITGGGGSIGSEIALQVSRHNPKNLIIFDIYENNAYSIQHKILRENPDCPLEVLIGSVRDSRRVNDIFRRYRPDIVYHAAAHKHVPLMEDSPCEAIKNNVIGTYKVAYAAMMYGTKNFVLVSTDKAVNPTNIMGASKRLCELVVQSFDKMIKKQKEDEIPVLHVHQEDEDGSMYPLAEGTQRFDDGGKEIFTFPGQDDKGHRKAQTKFSCTRFGNVLGSNGSVIPVFKDQIANPTEKEYENEIISYLKKGEQNKKTIAWKIGATILEDGLKTQYYEFTTSQIDLFCNKAKDINLPIKNKKDLSCEDLRVSYNTLLDLVTITKMAKTAGVYINADDIKKASLCTDIEAAVKAEELREKSVKDRVDFTFETVLSTRRNLDLLIKAKENGYFIRCIYVLTSKPEINLVRIKIREQSGGHPLFIWW